MKGWEPLVQKDKKEDLQILYLQKFFSFVEFFNVVPGKENDLLRLIWIIAKGCVAFVTTP